MTYQIEAHLAITLRLLLILIVGAAVIYGLKVKKHYAYLVFAILSFMASIVMIGYSIEPFVLSNETHSFKVSVEPTDDDLFISDFNLFYDFGKQEGEIQFYAGGAGMKKLELLRIFLPANSTFTNVILFNQTDEDKNKIFVCISEDDKKDEDAICRIDSMNDLLEIDFWKQKTRFRLHAQFKGTLRPDSKFLFENDNRMTESRKKGLFSFYLGDYECKDNCLLSSWDRISLDTFNNPTKPKILINKNSESVKNRYKAAGREEFMLNVQNKKSEFYSNLYLALSTGFFIVTFALLIEFIITSLYRKKKRSKKPRLQRRINKGI